MQQSGLLIFLDFTATSGPADHALRMLYSAPRMLRGRGAIPAPLKAPAQSLSQLLLSYWASESRILPSLSLGRSFLHLHLLPR